MGGGWEGAAVVEVAGQGVLVRGGFSGQPAGRQAKMASICGLSRRCTTSFVGWVVLVASSLVVEFASPSFFFVYL